VRRASRWNRARLARLGSVGDGTRSKAKREPWRTRLGHRGGLSGGDGSVRLGGAERHGSALRRACPGGTRYESAHRRHRRYPHLHVKLQVVSLPAGRRCPRRSTAAAELGFGGWHGSSAARVSGERRRDARQLPFIGRGSGHLGVRAKSRRGDRAARTQARVRLGATEGGGDWCPPLVGNRGREGRGTRTGAGPMLGQKTGWAAGEGWRANKGEESGVKARLSVDGPS
jgi:hypothetical protein